MQHIKITHKPEELQRRHLTAEGQANREFKHEDPEGYASNKGLGFPRQNIRKELTKIKGVRKDI